MSPDTVIKKAACFFCHNHCGVLVQVEDGRVVKVAANPDHPRSRGFICARAVHAPRWLYHPGQLQRALKRVGARGEGKWQEISWEQAVDEIAEKLARLKQEYGPETLVVAEGTYRSDHFWARSRFLNLFGNPQNLICPGMVCLCNEYSLHLALAGTMIAPDISRAKCVVLWGSNRKESRLVMWRVLKRRMERQEVKVIVVDPWKTEAAAEADLCLQLRPGTDAALALGWIHVIIREGLYDREFVERWTHGFRELAERVKEYTPQKVAEITGLTPEEIVQSARLYATTPPACIDRGVAADQLGRNSLRIEQARVILGAITGNLDVPGGDLMCGPPSRIDGRRFVCDSELELADRCPVENRAKLIGSDRFKLMSWQAWELVAPHYERFYGVPCPQLHYIEAPTPVALRQIISGEPYPVKALITVASNPVMWAPNTRLVLEALTHPNLELHVVLEYWMTPTAQLADYVLPAASWLERPLCTTTEDWFPVVVGGERAVPPLGERHEDYQFWRALGLRLGQAEYWPWKDLEEVIRYRLADLGISFEEFVEKGGIYPAREYKKYQKGGFPTPTGKLELASTVLEKLGYDPLPYYEEPPESPVRTPERAKEYPLILNTGGRFMPQFHSEHRHWGIGLRERHPDPLVTLHPQTAEKLGIREGDWVYIETARGRIRQKARLSEGMRPDVVNVEASWWFPEKPGELPVLFGALEANANVLTLEEPDALDPLTGGWCNRALLCRVYRADEEA
ncbi:MAG: molybdopterin-containing oxidoreductase family protein [Moorellales bacterium]